MIIQIYRGSLVIHKFPVFNQSICTHQRATKETIKECLIMEKIVDLKNNLGSRGKLQMEYKGIMQTEE